MQMNATRLTIPNMANQMSLETTGSGSEDFRSIVDDLTVENKKLKRKLLKYEKMYDAHLQQEKLFEIRVHGLSGNKKRELEETLRKFAQSLGQEPKESTNTESVESSSTPALMLQPTSSSRTSTRFQDSAYASNSASVGNSSVPASHAEKPQQKPRTAESRREDIQSYLHDIPVGLLPRQPVAMTEKAKRKLVVRRLEQIFAGKTAAIGGHQQPEQQQEVSQSAATADRMALEATGRFARAEGIREARIFRKGSPDEMPPAVLNAANAGKSSPEQRPTRPLDLDPHRAQVSRDNINYIRHLGFSPAHVDTPEERDMSHGWIYLNVVANMAQLHTLNVTTEFVKKSISNYSSKLQLSRDGRKVRWKGGHDVTRTSSNGSPDTGTQSPSSKGKGKGSESRRSNANISPSNGSSESPTRDSSSNKLTYVPLFVHTKSSSDDDTSEEQMQSWDSPHQEQLAGDSSGFTSSGVRTHSTKRKRGDEGPIIFYNKAKFCTDLSGDRGNNPTGFKSSIKYDTVSTNPVGLETKREAKAEERGPLGRDTPSNDAMDIDEDARSSATDPVNFSPKNLTSWAEASSSPAPMDIDFEVSGLGGVLPEDNFQIMVQSHQTSAPEHVPSRATHFARHRLYPRKIMDALESKMPNTKPSKAPVQDHVMSIRRKELASSSLPPPASLFHFGSLEDSLEDSISDSGAESDESGFDNDEGFPPSTVPQMLHFSSNSSDEDSDSTDDENDDNSVDFLAMARELDPKTVHEREREYHANMAERVAEEIPAGSSAATAGGGSGYSTPATGDHGGPLRASQMSPGLVSSLKRSRAATAESTTAQVGEHSKTMKLEDGA